MNQKQALLQSIELTEEILEVLDSGGFDRIDELENARQLLIKQAFAESIHQLDQIKAEYLQKLNQKVVAKLTLFKESILVQHTQVRKAARATQAYQELNDISK